MAGCQYKRFRRCFAPEAVVFILAKDKNCTVSITGMYREEWGDRVVDNSRQPVKYTSFSARFHWLLSLLREPVQR